MKNSLDRLIIAKRSIGILKDRIKETILTAARERKSERTTVEAQQWEWESLTDVPSHFQRWDNVDYKWYSNETFEIQKSQYQVG